MDEGESFIEFLKKMAEQAKKEVEGESEEEDRAEKIKYLKRVSALYLEKHQFKPGDVVDYKDPSLAGAHKYTGPFVVIEVREKPIVDTSGDSSNSWWYTEHDIRLAALFSHSSLGNRVVMHWYDSRLFKKIAE